MQWLRNTRSHLCPLKRLWLTFENLIVRLWNRSAAGGKSNATLGAGLLAGHLVKDEAVTRTAVRLAEAKRPEHLSCLGKTGMGKSHFLRSMAFQMLSGPDGAFASLTFMGIPRPCCSPLSLARSGNTALISAPGVNCRAR